MGVGMGVGMGHRGGDDEHVPCTGVLMLSFTGS